LPRTLGGGFNLRPHLAHAARADGLTGIWE